MAEYVCIEHMCLYRVYAVCGLFVFMSYIVRQQSASLLPRNPTRYGWATHISLTLFDIYV